MSFLPADIVSLHGRGQLVMTSVSELHSIAARDNYTEVRLANGTQVVIRRTLKAWEDVLPSSHFLRVHRTLIVNLSRIERCERDRSEHTRLYLAGTPEPLRASRRVWSRLRTRLAALRPAM